MPCRLTALRWRAQSRYTTRFGLTRLGQLILEPAVGLARHRDQAATTLRRVDASTLP
jgi:hypothetical protein